MAYPARMILRRRRYKTTRTMAMMMSALAGVDPAMMFFMKEGQLLAARRNFSACPCDGRR